MPIPQSPINPRDLADVSALFLRQLPKGIFLNVGGPAPNTMTIGWGAIGNYWGKQAVVTVPVRPQRHTFPILSREKAFVLSIPDGDMKKELAQAGTLSGRDGDKFKAIGLTTAPAKYVDAPILPDCAWQAECRVLSAPVLLGAGATTDPDVAGAMYAANDFHTLFMAEIVALYKTARV